jgi:transcriptional regulator with XRE-family HTH domain
MTETTAAVAPVTASAGRRLQPALYRQQVAGAVRQARQVRGLTQQEAAGAVEFSLSKLMRIEAGATGLSVTDLRALLDLYQVTGPAQAARLESMTRAARCRPWFAAHRVVTPDLASYLDAERSAAAIGGLRIRAVPGLLQTADYARALLRGLGADRVDERVELLLARQELLDSGDCPDLCYMVDEAVVHRVTGGPAVMDAQLDRLRDLSAHPRVRVGILPLTAGAWALSAGAFTVIGCGDGDGTFSFHEAADGRLICSSDPGLAGRYREHLARMHAMALPVPQARELLAAATRFPGIPAATGCSTGPAASAGPEPGARRRTGQDSGRR